MRDLDWEQLCKIHDYAVEFYKAERGLDIPEESKKRPPEIFTERELMSYDDL